MTARNAPDDIKTKQKSYAIKKVNRVIASLYLKGPFSRCTTELCESRGGRPRLPVPNGPYGLCGRKATVNNKKKGFPRFGSCS